jgi:hypothetical protein
MDHHLEDRMEGKWIPATSVRSGVGWRPTIIA